MQHTIPPNGRRTEAMANAIGSCVHCGFCLSTCPTYLTLGREEDSPRGRIFLMKEVLEGNLALQEVLEPLDNCLGCQACVTACPSGVEYGDLITAFRAQAEPQRSRPAVERARRALVAHTLPHPRRLRAAARVGRLTRRLAPPPLRPMVGLLPERLPKRAPLPEIFPAEGERRARVALLAGCAQQALDPDIGWATLRVLARNGVETVSPSAQGCCGALAMHGGDAERAREFARRNLRAFPADVDAIVTNAAGCGSGMQEYGLLFADEPEHDAAREFAERVVDVAKFLDDLGFVAPQAARPLRVVYHDACHLAHAQRVREAPVRLLAAAGHEVVIPDEWELCCGSAGTYNVERPQIAAELGRRKAQNLLAGAPEAIAAGNIGCLTQLRPHLGEVPVLHTMQLLDRFDGP
jgi:glycolate oxidase iron-sulfur subunit